MVDFSDLRLKERLADLNVRELLEENSTVATIGAVVLLMVALGILLLNLTGGGQPDYQPLTQKYFYDLNTRELFAVDFDELPPIERGAAFEVAANRTIPAGVEAIVMSCESCEGGLIENVAWVETLRPDHRAQILEARRQAANGNADLLMADAGEDYERLVMDIHAAQPRFVPKFSEEGQALMGQAMRCKETGEVKKMCYPD